MESYDFYQKKKKMKCKKKTNVCFENITAGRKKTTVLGKN